MGRSEENIRFASISKPSSCNVANVFRAMSSCPSVTILMNQNFLLFSMGPIFCGLKDLLLLNNIIQCTFQNTHNLTNRLLLFITLASRLITRSQPDTKTRVYYDGTTSDILKNCLVAFDRLY